MATNDVPGANPANQDKLCMGCWAEHADGSLIVVESTEGGRVIYSMFDVSKDPPIEYRDSMPEVSFKTTFSWKPSDPKSEKWLWHDKTPFPWDRVIKSGFDDGMRFPSVGHMMTAAERVAQSLHARGAAVSRDMGHRAEQIVTKKGGIFDKLSRAIAELGK